jgi:hypothetical protein
MARDGLPYIVNHDLVSRAWSRSVMEAVESNDSGQCGK